ncbi:MAG: hypothetical protein AAF437_14620 [Pseudomonadota bacterium]
MMKRLASASICFALASVASAETGAKDVSDADSQVVEENDEGLDAFVDAAIRSGLLVANGDQEVEVSQETLVNMARICGDAYPLDLSAVKTLRRFTELPSASASDDEDPERKLTADLKAKLALGLYAEAKALLASRPETEREAYRKLIALMENRQRPDLDYFKTLAGCYPEASLWHAVAQLVVFDREGVDGIAVQIAAIRALPFNMREDVSMLAIPTLLIERRGDLAQQILATFTPEEIENSTRLSALKTAVIDMPTGAESDDRLVMLMSRPKLKLAALLILVERDASLRPNIRSFALEEAWNVLEQSETQHDLDPILEFVIKHLASDDLYAGLDRVRALPVADREDVRASIDNYTMIALDDYLSDEDPGNAINALETLNTFHADLPINARGNALRKQGATKAIELGLFSMVKHFLEPVDREPQVGLLLATAAFWGHANQELFAVRDEFPQLPEVNRMAGIRALQANLPVIAGKAYDALTAHPSLQLELLEQGAIENNWALWKSDFAALVAGLDDTEVLRLDRVRTIQIASRKPPADGSRRIRPYQISDLLNASRQVLSKTQAGAANEQ